MRSSTPSNYARRPSTSSSASNDTASSTSDFDPRSMLLPGQIRHSTIILSPAYRRALSMFVLTMLHLFLTAVTTVILLVTLPKAPADGSPPAFPDGAGREHPSERAVRVWATTLGLASVVLGCLQYMPQLVLTARRKLVGSLSIPMMMLQVGAQKPVRECVCMLTLLSTRARLPVLSPLSTRWPSGQASTGVAGPRTCKCSETISSLIKNDTDACIARQHHWHPTRSAARAVSVLEAASEATRHRRLGAQQDSRGRSCWCTRTQRA